MSIFDFLNPVKALVDTVSGVIKDFVPDPAQKLALQQQVLDAQTALQAKAMDLQGQIIDAQQKAITTEAQGDTLQRDWRPVLMLFFGACVGWIIVGGGTNIHGVAIPADYVNWVLRIVAIGVGGYVTEPVVTAFKGGNGNGK